MMPRFRTFLAVAAALLLLAAKSPQTERRPVTDHHHGVAVVDEYRWLEDANDDAVKKWVATQNQHTRKYLDSIRSRPAIEKRVRELFTARPASYSAPKKRGDRLFAMKFQPPNEQAFLVTLASPDDPASERVLLDPVKLAPTPVSPSTGTFRPSMGVSSPCRFRSTAARGEICTSTTSPPASPFPT